VILLLDGEEQRRTSPQFTTRTGRMSPLKAQHRKSERDGEKKKKDRSSEGERSWTILDRELEKILGGKAEDLHIPTDPLARGGDISGKQVSAAGYGARARL